jgi:hypothetical protein
MLLSDQRTPGQDDIREPNYFSAHKKKIFTCAIAVLNPFLELFEINYKGVESPLHRDRNRSEIGLHHLELETGVGERGTGHMPYKFWCAAWNQFDY